jgi:hypothetical protein
MFISIIGLIGIGIGGWGIHACSGTAQIKIEKVKNFSVIK